MSNRTKGLILVMVLAAALAAGVFGYRALAKRHSGSALVAEDTTSVSEEAVAAANADESAGGSAEADANPGEGVEGDTEADATTGANAATSGSAAEPADDDLPAAVDFQVYNKDGDVVSLSDFYGTPTIINIWASWCPPCKAEMPYFDEAYREYGSQINFMMINLTDGYQETTETADAYIAEQGYAFPIYYDTELSAAMAYGAYSIPMTIIVTADGKISAQRLGSMDRETFYDLVNQTVENP